MGGKWNQLSTFDAEFKFAKIQNSHFIGGWGGGEDFAKFDAEFKLLKFKIPILWGGGVGDWGGLRNLMLSSNLLKSKIPILLGDRGAGGRWGRGFTEIDAEFKFAKIQNSHFMRGWGWVCGI